MKPSKGRTVLYTFPSDEQLGYNLPAGQEQTVPAVIVNVFSETCVNLRVFQDGPAPPISATSVPLKDVTNENFGRYWEWPPRVDG